MRHGYVISDLHMFSRRSKAEKEFDRIYDLVEVHIIHPKWLLSRRILNYLHNVLSAEIHRVKEVYFGHTHCPFSNYHYGGIVFYNTGSAIKGLALQTHRVVVEDVHLKGLHGPG